MRRATLILISALAGSSCSEEVPDGNPCADAAVLVGECYGGGAAADFAATCTAEEASEVVAAGCGSEADGKADAVRNNWLCRTFGLVCDRAEQFEAEEDHFKYGSLGTENPGLPVGLLQALPQICPEKWPKSGWQGFGLITEPGRPLPVGFSIRRFAGVALVTPNCAQCHVSTVRDAPGATPRVFLGGPGQQADATAVTSFILECLTDERLTRENLSQALKQIDGLGVMERVGLSLAASTLRRAAKPTADSLLRLTSGERRPGPGRSDAFNVRAVTLLGWDLPNPPFSNSDFGAAWRAESEPDDLVNWDGNSNDMHESNLTVVLALGASETSVDNEGLERVEAFLDRLPAPAFPYPVDIERAQAGRKVFEVNCAGCHERGGERFGTVIPASEVGTDLERAKISTTDMVDAMHGLSAGDWEFSSFRPSEGYVAGRLDGAWLRAPYLHNGSVPTLAALLSPPEARPTTFYRGGDVYDRVAVGFVSDTPVQGDRELFLYDTAHPGQSNAGHVYGTDLPSADRGALIEYLKVY